MFKIDSMLEVSIKCLHTSNFSDVACFRSGVMYKLTCSCGEAYIGEAIRNLKIRLREHATSDKSDMCEHSTGNPQHWIDFEYPKILGTANDTTRLRISESLFIQEQSPELNNDSQSVPLKLFNI